MHIMFQCTYAICRCWLSPLLDKFAMGHRSQHQSIVCFSLFFQLPSGKHTWTTRTKTDKLEEFPCFTAIFTFSIFVYQMLIECASFILSFSRVWSTTARLHAELVTEQTEPTLPTANGFVERHQRPILAI